jgi:photosystem II stability/assembly factor-like uncharacterized protein
MYLAVDPGDTVYVGSGIDGPYANRSIDNGDKWTRIDRDTAVGLISFAFNRSGHIFSGNAYGVVLRSTNSCETWTELRNGLPPVGAISPDINALVINTKGYLFAGAEGGLCRSTNNGDNWERIDSQLPSSIRNIDDTGHIDYFGFPRIRTVVINSKGHIFVGYDRGVYRSTNDGESWTDFNKGISLNTTVMTLALDKDGYLYAGTSDGAVFKTSQSTN